MENNTITDWDDLAAPSALTPTPVAAEPAPQADAPTEGTCGDNLTWKIENNVLTISGTGAMRDYGIDDFTGADPAPWSGFTSVVIENGVTSIGEHAFYFCSSLTNITIPNSVTSIGYGAFNYCDGLTAITIPRSVTSIGGYAFAHCTRLTNIMIPDSVTSIDYNAFYECSGLTTITIPDSVTSIDYHAFDGCSGLTTITIPDSVTFIGIAAFNDCSGLTTITIPDSVTSIEDVTFQNCSSLTSITIPNSVTSIGDFAFRYCSSLSDVYYGGDETNWAAIKIGDNNEDLTNATIHYNSNAVPDESENGIKFEMLGAAYNVADDTSLYPSYKVTDDDDSIGNRCQTIFILDEDDQSPVTETQIYPVFETTANLVVLAGINNAQLGVQQSGQTPVDFGGTSGIGFGKAIEYSVYAQNGQKLDNYWVTFLTKQSGGAKLFVNGANIEDHMDNGVPYREVKLENPDGVHNILFANIGDEPLTGLSVTLDAEAQKMLQLDDNFAKELAPFTSAQTGAVDGGNAENGALPNIGKIRLLPQLDENGKPKIGAVNGALTIRSSNGGIVTIKLIGAAGKLEITTEKQPEGVKYVPYAGGIQTNAAADSRLRFEIIDGVLPSGLSVDYNTGAICGVPGTSGEFKFTIRATMTGTNGESILSATKEFTLNIMESTDEATFDEMVFKSTDPGYELTQCVGTPDPDNRYRFIWTDEDGDGVLISNGAFEEFVALYLDGEELERDVEYTVREGSTIATIQAQTLRKNGSGVHTLSAEFNKDKVKRGTNMKRASQNYYYPPKKSNRRPNRNNGNRGGGSSSSGGAPSVNTPSVPSAPESAPMTFLDVLPGSWYYEDVKWAFDNKIMEGVNEQTFAPDAAISQGTIVLTLARMAKINLDQFKNMSVEGIPSGTWYTEAAIWAKQSGLVKDPNKFTGSDVLKRDEMAVTLVKFLRSLSKAATAPEQSATFADAADMSEQGKEAFQILYKMGVFKGVGNNRMDPNGTTTRAQFAALLHRLSDTALK